ncbi:MAG: hypothetical protein L0170_04965 [Acidobacteria bacterium]|nr:hypothetical protein [Acidobacteriota bacterium]
MTNPSVPETNFNLTRVWVERARKNSARCYVCLRIARENEKEEGEFRNIKICGVEFSSESQIAHLARCVGKEAGGV